MSDPTFLYPGPVFYSVSSAFGPRPAPVGGASTFHEGVDLNFPDGDPVWASSDGTVIYCAYESGAGNTLTLDHGGGWQTRYHHLSRALVGNGAHCRAGQEIAWSGATGNVGGPHLHFEIRDRPDHPVDPWPYISGGPGPAPAPEEPNVYPEDEDTMLIINKQSGDVAIIVGTHRPRKIASVNDYQRGTFVVLEPDAWDQYWNDAIKLYNAALGS